MVALLGVASVIFIRTTLSNKLEIELQKRGVSIASHLAEDIVTPLLTENILELQMILLTHKRSDQDIEYIFVETSDGKGTFAYIRSSVPDGLDQPETKLLPAGSRELMEYDYSLRKTVRSSIFPHRY